MFKYKVFSGPYFPAFGLNTERYEVSIRIQSEYKIRTRKKPVFGNFSRSAGFSAFLISDQGEIYSQWSDWSPCDPDNNCQKMRQRFCSHYNNIKCPEANVYGVHNEYDRCSARECYRKFVTEWMKGQI